MNYNLSNKQDRKRFVLRANHLLKQQRGNVSLTDESNRTLNQNSYIHVLCRIIASDTGVSESYAKQVYFKQLANPNIFMSMTKDPLTGELIKFVRSTKDLSITEMRFAIEGFRRWASENGYALPEAILNDDGSMSFATSTDKDSFNQAIVETSKCEGFL